MGAGTAIPPRLGSVRDVARRLGMSDRWVWKALASGRMIRPVRLGHAVRFDLEELDRWIDAGCPAQADWEHQRKGGPRP